MAAPTSTNEVTARRLTRLLVGSDGNGGLWKKVGDKVTNAIGALDVASVGGAGKYISAISETDGKISATATSMDTAPTASSTNAVTSGGIKTALDGKASSSHTHGNIQNGGTLQTNDITIANGDKLVVTDASDSNKVARTSISFDGSQYGYLLSKKGTWEYPKEAYLEWGGRNYTSTFGPLDAALVSELGANRLAFGKAAGITIEYTRDGGTTWIDYGASNELKSGLFSTIGKYAIVVGKADGNNKATTTENYLNYKVRVIIDATAFQIYNQFRKFVFYVSTNGSAGCYVVASGVSKSATTDTWTSLGEFNLQGWSGYNVFNKYIAIGTGGSADYKKVCFLFETRSAPTNQNYNGLAIAGILGFGGVGWTTPSTMAFTGHLYSYDGLQNAAFPAKVTAASFAGPLTGDVTGNLSGTATKANYLTGFTSRNTSNISWGTLTPANGYTTVTEMRYTSGSQDPGAIAFGYKAGSGTSYDLSCQIDGLFYQREGGKRVLDVSDINSSFYAPTGAGTSGQLLKSSGSGAPTWATANAALVGITVTSTSVSDGSTTFNKYTHPTTSGNKHVPSGGSSGQFLGWSADGTAAWVANPNTDTKVTAVGNHYTPSGGTSKDASGGSATQLPTSSTGTLTQVVTGVTVDAAGHVTGVSSKGLWSPNNTYSFNGTTFYSGNSGNATHDANSMAYNGVYYWDTNGPAATTGWTPRSGSTPTDGAIYAQAYSSAWVGQIAQDYRNGNLAVRGKNNDTWTDWNRIVDQQAFASGTGVNLISAFRTGTCSRFTVTNPTNLNAGASFTHDLSTGDSYIRMIVLESIADGETVTLSFDVENLNVSNNEYISFFMQALTGPSKFYKVTANGRQVFVITKNTTTEIPANSILLGFDDGPTHYSVVAPSGFTIKNIKLERGSIATPYSRHPSEDQTKVYYVEGPNTFTAYSSSSTYTKWASGNAYTSSNSCQYNGVAYYCSTAITTAESWNSSHWTQVPTVDWTGTIPGLTALYTGLKIAYKIPSARGGSTSTRLNINGLGPNTVYRNAGNNTTSHLPAGTIVNLTFDGTYWKWADYADGNDWVTSMGAYCTTASSTQAKAATSYGTVYTAGETFLIRFSNSNTYNGKITLNINSQGAKDVWINGAVSSSSNKTLPAGEHWCHYDGSKFLIWTDGTAQFTKLKASATDFPVMTDQEVTDLLGAMTA